MNDVKDVVQTFLIPILSELADSAYQERVWFQGKGPEIDSFDESAETFFEICDMFNHPKYKDELLPAHLHAVNELSKLIHTFCSTISKKETDDIKLLLSNPNWIAIQQEAARVLHMIETRENR